MIGRSHRYAKDYAQRGNKGLYRSTKPNADGTYNQYRMDNGSLSGSHKPNVPHVHLEVIQIQKTKMKGVGGKEIILTDEKQIINNHIPIE